MGKTIKERVSKMGVRLRAVKAVMTEPFFEVVTVNAKGIECQGWMPSRIWKPMADALDDVKIEIMREVEK